MFFFQTATLLPRTLRVATYGLGPKNLTVRGDRVGSIDCWQYSVSKVKVESGLPWISPTSPLVFNRISYSKADLYFSRNVATKRHFT